MSIRHRVSKLEDRHGGGVSIFLPQIADDGMNRHVQWSSKAGEFSATFTRKNGEPEAEFSARAKRELAGLAAAKRMPGEVLLLLNPDFSGV